MGFRRSGLLCILLGTAVRTCHYFATTAVRGTSVVLFVGYPCLFAVPVMGLASMVQGYQGP